VATQNPIDTKARIVLPEAQLDRFLFKIQSDLSSFEQEVSILAGHHQRKNTQPDRRNGRALGDEIRSYREVVRQIHVEDNGALHRPDHPRDPQQPALFLGASPRARWPF